VITSRSPVLMTTAARPWLYKCTRYILTVFRLFLPIPKD